MLLAVETVYVVLILASFVVSEPKVCQRGAVSFVVGIQCSAPLNSISRARTRLSFDGSAVLNSTQRKDLADVPIFLQLLPEQRSSKDIRPRTF